MPQRATFVRTKRIGTRRTPTIVLRSPSSFSIDKLLGFVTATSIERRKDGRITLFLCHVSQSCPCEELKMFRTPTRMDLDSGRGTIRLWHMAHNPRRPDVVIENVVASPAAT